MDVHQNLYTHRLQTLNVHKFIFELLPVSITLLCLMMLTQLIIDKTRVISVPLNSTVWDFNLVKAEALRLYYNKVESGLNEWKSISICP